MEYIVQIRGDHRIYPIPEGLYELMADITREVFKLSFFFRNKGKLETLKLAMCERDKDFDKILRVVLRSQPQNLYKFIYNYLDAQIKTRVLTIEALKILNEIIIDGQPMTCYLAERGLTYDEANEAARKIQHFWRRVSSMRKIRRGTTEEDKKRRKSYIQEIEMGFKTEQILRKYKLSFKQASNFVTKIQAVYRGYVMRKSLKQEIPREDSFASWDHDWLWEHFEDEESLSLIPPDKLAEATKKLLKYLPRRHIAVNKLKLKNILRGAEEDYERESSPSIEFEGLRIGDRSRVLRRPTPDEEWEEELPKDYESIFLTMDEAASEEEEEEEEVSLALTEVEAVEEKEALELPGEEEPREYLREEELVAEEEEEREGESEVVEGVAIDEEQEEGKEEPTGEPAVEEEKKEVEIPEYPTEDEQPEFVDDYVLYGEGIPDEIQQYSEYSEDAEERIDAGEDIVAGKDSETEDEGGEN